MPTSKVYMTGQGGVTAALRRVTLRLEQTVPEAMLAAGNHLLQESKKLVPVEFGELKDSGFVSGRRRGFFMEVQVGYSAPYAAYVHEAVEMKLRGQPRPSGKGNYWDPPNQGQAKFLEQPMRNLQSELFSIIKGKVKIQ